MQHSNQKQLGKEKGLFHLVLPGLGPSLRDVRTGTQSRSLKVDLLATLTQ